MRLWFTSDYHLGHENIIRYSQRPFSNAKEMDEALLQYHNELVKPEDHVYNLGDVTMLRGGAVQQAAFIARMKQFHGHKRLLLGNHDHFPISTYLTAGFEKIYATWRGIENILLSHFPVHPSSIGSAVANVHGHIHQNASPAPVVFKGYVESPSQPKAQPYINICVEHTNYRPIPLEDLQVRIRTAVKRYEESQS